MKGFLWTGLAVVIAAGAAFWWMFRGPDLSRYESLETPRLTSMADQRVLEVEVKGDPNEALPQAFKELFRIYFRLPGVPKGSNRPALRFRMPVPVDLPKSEWEAYFRGQGWTGYVAMPVPDSVASLPANTRTSLPARLTTWTYGEVGEILHRGPYDQETPAIEILEAFLRKRGVVPIGIHEEEYLRGPGMPFSKPENYATILRYPVRPAAAATRGQTRRSAPTTNNE